MGSYSKLAALLLFARSLAQVATVLAVRGDVLVYDNGRYVKLHAGNKLFEHQKIKVGGNGYVALIIHKGGAKEIKNQGTYLVQDLISSTRTSLYSAKYTGYVLNQAIASGASYYSGKTLGAVTRSTMAPEIDVPSNCVFYPDRILLQWHRVPGSQGYIVQIYNHDGSILYKNEVGPETLSITVNLDTIVKPNLCYYWSVSTVRYPTVKSNNKCFKTMSNEQAEKIKMEENNLIRCLNLNTAIDNVILAAFYEKHKLFSYAIECYKRANTIEPNTDGYEYLIKTIRNRALKEIKSANNIE